MIRDLDATIAAWLSELAPYAAVSFDLPPQRAPNAKQARPTLSLMLVDVQENSSVSSHAWTNQRDGEGQVIGRVPPNRSYGFTYLVSATAGDTLAEHELLGTVLAGAALNNVIPEAHLRGVLSDCARMLVIRCAAPREDDRGHERWAAWNLTGRTSFELWVLAPLPVAPVQEVPAAPSHIDLKTSRSYRPLAMSPESPSRRPTGHISED